MREPSRERAGESSLAFQEAVEFFIRACPGPPLAMRGLRMVAYQRIRGISELEDGRLASQRNVDISRYIEEGGDMSLRLSELPTG